MSSRALMGGPLARYRPLVLETAELAGLGDRIVADPSTCLLAAYAAWKQVDRP